MATGGGCRGASRPLVVVSGSARDVFDESTVYQGSKAPTAPPPSLWAHVPADVLGVVLHLLPCLSDSASVRSVCRHWRAAAIAQVLPAALPVLVLPGFRFSCLASDGSLTVPRRALMPVEVAGDDVRMVGSCDEWLVASLPSWHSKETGAECFLVHVFSSEVIHLPCLQESPSSYIWLDKSRSGRPIRRFINGTKEQEPLGAVLSNTVLSVSPSSGSKYVVAALCYHSDDHGLALWQHGMASWCLCRSAQINYFRGNLAFYEGKLYVVQYSRPEIIAFELREDEHGVSLSCPIKQYAIGPLVIPSNKPTGVMRSKCNIVVWRGKLLLIIRFFSKSMFKMMECKPHSVEVFALDVRTSPCGVTQIHNLHDDCIFVQDSGCRCFSAGLHTGVVQGDLIYFSDGGCIDVPYVYNIRDGTVTCFATGLSDGCIGFPIWIFPS